MKIVVVDAPMKVGALRLAFPGDRLIDIEFPLFNRFSRKLKKVKDTVFPDLKPVSKPELTKLTRAATGDDVDAVLGVFDNNEYGRVQARDLAYALADINVDVEIKYVGLYTHEAVDAVASELPPPVDIDTRYILNRVATSHVTQILEAYVGSDVDFNLSWQQAFVLGLIHDNHVDPRKASVFIDSIGRKYTGSVNDRTVPVKAVRTSVSVPRRGVLELVDAGLELDAIYPTLDRLRGTGSVPVTEIKLDDPQFGALCDQVSDRLNDLGINDDCDQDFSRGYTVANLDFDVRRLVSSDACKNLYTLLVQETLLAGCASVDVVCLSGAQSGLDFCEYVTPTEKSWLGLADIKTFPAAQPANVNTRDLKEELDFPGVTSKLLCTLAAGVLSDRDLWSACTWLVRKSFVVLRGKHWFLGSRGCLAVKLLSETLAVSLTPSLGKHIRETCRDYLDTATNSSDEIRQAELLVSFNAYLEEQTRRIDPVSFWSDFAGSAQPNVSDSAVWFDKGSQKYGLALSSGDFTMVPEHVRVFDPCPVCRADLVDTILDTTYVTAVACSCGITRPAVSVLKE